MIPREPAVTINGQTLSSGQAMALRVAVGQMLLDMADPEYLGGGEHAERMRAIYQARLREIQALMVGGEG